MHRTNQVCDHSPHYLYIILEDLAHCLLAVRIANGIATPAGDTCDLIIVDRAFDLIAPVIHEWTYEAIASDILDLRNNVFQYQTETQGG